MTSQRSRSATQLRALYASRRSRSVSLADGPGFLYAFVEYGHRWKIGMTNSYNRRKAEWDHLASSAHNSFYDKVVGVTSRNSSSLENGDAFGEGRFGQCLCVLDLRKVIMRKALELPANNQELLEISRPIEDC
ncbi:uncharacterized protein C8R40DRAFT_1075394 [Lentinula edodes]|uniref:uncharacterized protein n=1 Tax=Lentinula edodes TaxID=5353 RepID=UPI001E8CCB1B|nr:uncharacterized protein C8R40DRAFT_1075394 [Lentinula edodes]KAH7867708.1 hypothetical protein C8R40DRAFT_1075394 [Lentinula edodes]